MSAARNSRDAVQTPAHLHEQGAAAPLQPCAGLVQLGIMVARIGAMGDAIAQACGATPYRRNLVAWMFDRPGLRAATTAQTELIAARPAARAAAGDA